MTVPSMMGARVKRKEDPYLLTGKARFVANLSLPDMRHVAFVRSPYAHARIVGIDASAALAMAGVQFVMTGAEFAPLCVPLPLDISNEGLMAGAQTHFDCVRSAIAVDRVRYVGEIVAVVVAESAALAEDAALAVLVHYEPLHPFVGLDSERPADAVPIFDQFPDNVALRVSNKTDGVDEAFANAAHVVRQRMSNNRLVAHPIEGRAILVAPDALSEGMTIWVSAQMPHAVRTETAKLMKLPENSIRVICPDVGGAFGVKDGVYAEHAIVAILARHLQMPLRWIEGRSEHVLATTHARAQLTDVELALDAEGTMTGLRLNIHADLGAYPMGPSIPKLTMDMAVNVYRIPKVDVQLTCVLTNTTPVVAYRGAGRPEAIHYLERIIEIAAQEIGMNAIELRRRNFIPPDAFPYATPTGMSYDSGEYARTLDKALALAHYDELRKAQRHRRSFPELPQIGIGLSCYTELCTFGYESATVRVDPSGTVTAFTGVSPHGQGSVTTFAQIIADQIGAEFDRVVVRHGDTHAASFGMGTAGSRGVAVGGSAIYQVAGKVQEKARQIAAHMLEAAAEDIVLVDGKYQVRGSPQHSVSLVQIAQRAYNGDLPAGMTPGLEATDFFKPKDMTFPSGVHIAVVEVDRETGVVRLRDMFAVDDCGVRINPMLADGQIHGGLTQGIAQALWEEARYDEQGQLLTGTLMEYALPRADQLPSYTLDETVTPTPRNPLGAKGLGEAATIGSPPAVVNAVLDALGVRHLDMPLTPEKVWRAANR